MSDSSAHGSVACCYLTHNHPDIVKSVLDKSLRDYEEHGIDVCVYDDSDDTKTRDVIDSFVLNGAKNLHYVDAHFAKDGDDKMLCILRGIGLPREYEYIWPVKDRTCYTATLLDRLCEVLAHEPDVIMIANEDMRWDISRLMNKEEYSNPAEFYRDYIAYTANWETTLRKRSTMLIPVDWERYIWEYRLDEECFLHSITLFVRLAEMTDCSIRICRFEQDERFIAPWGGSDWRSKLFEVWIERWIRANYKLPKLYDPWKIEAIRQQTSLWELFGSVDSMLGMRQEGIYDLEVYEKYRDFWPIVSSLPMEWLKLIATDQYTDLFNLVLDDFEAAFTQGDYIRAHVLMFTNEWFNEIYDRETYRLLSTCFMMYRAEMLTKGRSRIFDGIHSIEELKKRYVIES